MSHFATRRGIAVPSHRHVFLWTTDCKARRASRNPTSHSVCWMWSDSRMLNETTRNREEGKTYAAWGRSRPVSQPLPIKPCKLLVCGPGVISSPSYGMPCDTSSRSRLIDGLYRGSPPALYQTRKSTELVICPALTVSLSL